MWDGIGLEGVEGCGVCHPALTSQDGAPGVMDPGPRILG
jgi:hypothetical protein